MLSSLSASHAALTAPIRAPVAAMSASNQPSVVTEAQERLLMREALWKPSEVAPAYLDGSLSADFGFDPLCLVALGKEGIPLDGPWSVAERQAAMKAASPADAQARLEWMREAEIKHARLAMLAAVGWPLAELINPWSLGATNGRAPSVFNGGLDGVIVPFLLLAAAGAAYLETQPVKAGDYGFDPLDFYRHEGAFKRDSLRMKELVNGRVAMLAITGYAVQEFLWREPVVAQTPFFFGK